jgi:hypothetical protein
MALSETPLIVSALSAMGKVALITMIVCVGILLVRFAIFGGHDHRFTRRLPFQALLFRLGQAPGCTPPRL